MRININTHFFIFMHEARYEYYPPTLLYFALRRARQTKSNIVVTLMLEIASACHIVTAIAKTKQE